MRRRLWVSLSVMTAVGVAAADGAESHLYARAKNTHLNRTPEAGGQMLALLQPGTQVTDLGAAPVKNWRKVKSGVEGFVYLANLSAAPPHQEIVGERGNAALSPEAFASSGAATKALGAGAIDYGNNVKNYARAVKELQLAENASKAIEDGVLRDHEVAAKLHLVAPGSTGGKP